jgi:2'-hydroxyisoflavone reductase
MMRIDCSRAVAAGLSFRPLEETARETLAWSREVGEQRPTLSREREREILAGA